MTSRVARIFDRGGKQQQSFVIQIFHGP